MRHMKSVIVIEQDDNALQAFRPLVINYVLSYSNYYCYYTALTCREYGYSYCVFV